LQVLHEIANGEIRRIALAVVSVLLAQLEGSDIWHRNNFAAVPAAFEHSLDEPFVFPSETAKQDGDFPALLSRKRPLHGTPEMAQPGIVQIELLREPLTLGGETALQLLFGLNVSI
jgi:hypothetical protein